MPLPLGYSAVDLNSGAVAYAFPRNARSPIPITIANATESSASPITSADIRATKITKLAMSRFSCNKSE